MSASGHGAPESPAGPREKPAEEPVPCASGCGFFGNPLTENLCSKCFKDVQAERKAAAAEKAPSPVQQPQRIEKLPEVAQPMASPIPMESSDESASAKKKQKNRRRCFKCRSKVGLLGYECKCSYTFCGQCRYPEDHECEFDFQSEHRKKLKAENPACVAEKLQRI